MDQKTMSFTSKQSVCLVSTAILLVMSIQPAMAQEAPPPEEEESSTSQRFGGPNSVPGQLADDARLTESLTDRTAFQSYFDWKDRLREKHGVDFSLDYTAGILGATNTLRDDDTFAGGAVRFFGRWDLVGRKSGNTGTFVWKIENRHKYTDIPPSGTASQIGYVGIILPILSDIGTRLTNLYWKQNLNDDRIEIIAGMLDTTDWVDLYALASPWTGFYNFALATGGASIPVPDDSALGVYVNAMITDNLYVIGGFADANADSTNPFDGFDTFFNDREYFKSLELGWVTSRDRFYLDNTHITYWHADERVAAGVSGGWGSPTGMRMNASLPVCQVAGASISRSNMALTTNGCPLCERAMPRTAAHSCRRPSARESDITSRTTSACLDWDLTGANRTRAPSARVSTIRLP